MSESPQLLDIYQRHVVAQRYADMLTKGSPALGWAGDPGLRLAFNAGITQRWELLRHEPVFNDPDRHVVVMTGPPGMEINDEAINVLIRNLIAGDVQRPGNSLLEQMDRVLAANDKLELQKVEDGVNATFDALARFYTAAGKTLGVSKANFPTGRGLTGT